MAPSVLLATRMTDWVDEMRARAREKSRGVGPTFPSKTKRMRWHDLKLERVC